jgi:hypothetical protein
VNVIIPYTEMVTEKVKVGRKKEYVTNEVQKVFKENGHITDLIDGKVNVNFYTTRIPVSNSFRKVAESVYGRNYDNVLTVPNEYVHHTFDECGADSFAPKKDRVQFWNQDIASILDRAGYGRHSEDYNIRDGRTFQSINFNPYVIDANGEKQFYQRGLVWTLEQKQMLIDSIYNWIEIGKILMRVNSWERMVKVKSEIGEEYGRDCVDGKQRLSTIIEFVQNKFPDSNGNYWDDLSFNAKRKFLYYDMISFGELPERATDQDVIDSFLTLNFTGVPMSKEHIEYVRSFRMN